MKNKKKVLIAALGILGIVLTTVGVTVAWFTYSRTGTKENTITTGSIKFHYAEGSRTIDVDDMMPMTDAQGKAQDDYFEFTITSDTSRTLDIPYYITARRTNASDANMDSIVKVYLTKVDNNGNETQVLLSKFSGLSGYSNSAINIPASEKALYNDTVLAGTTDYSQTYRLRMWIDYDAKYIVQEENQPDQYPLKDKSYALTVNVYGEGNDIGESGKAARENTNIASMSIGSTQIPTTDGVNYSMALEVASTDDIPTSIVVDTVNPSATVTVEKLTAMKEVEKTNGIRRLSTQVPLDLEEGTNNFRITVTSQDKTKTKIYNLTVTVEIKQPESFAKDDWKTIATAVRTGNTSAYHVGDTKTITLGNGLGTHTVRIANMSTPAACINTGYSQTACGFIVEFADIISEKQMHTSGASNIAYPTTNVMFSYVTDTVYNALPASLRAVIKDTTVVSSHYNSDVCANCDGRDNNSNFVTQNQKIYLLSIQEIFGNNGEGNTAASTTHQLEYYSTNNNASSRIKNYNSGTNAWWTRSTRSDYNGNFHYVSAEGKLTSLRADYTFGVSPAFRIG